MTKQQYAWNGLGVPLAWLAGLDNGPAPNALPGAFGDSYLCGHNPIYAAIRNAALRLGYRFSAEDTPLWRDYQSLSLIALHRILSAKIIPYFDTSMSFRRLIDMSPGAHLPPGFIVRQLKKNYAFHESAHCVAHSVMRGIGAELCAIAPSEPDRAVLEAILAESFANTVEALGSSFQHMPVADNVFYPLNSYSSPNRGRTDLLKTAGASLGAELRFALVFFSYFEANLATELPTDSVYGRITEAAGCNAAQVGLAREITDSGFKLNPLFRENTTPVYFELIGLQREYRDLASADWLSRADNRSFVRALSRIFWDVAGNI